MGSEIVDDIKKLIEDLRGLHAACGEETYRNAADALERLSAENADLRARLEQAERDAASAVIGLEKLVRDELERFKKDWSVLRSESGVFERENKELRDEVKRLEQPRSLQELVAVLGVSVALAEERRKNCILLVQMIASVIKDNLDPDDDDAVTYLDVQISDWLAWRSWADVKVHEPSPGIFKAALMVRISGHSFYLPLVVTVESDEYVRLGCDEDVIDKYPVADLDSKLVHMALSMGRRAAALLAQNVADIALVSRMLFKEASASKPSTADWAFCPRCGGSLDTGW